MTLLHRIDKTSNFASALSYYIEMAYLFNPQNEHAHDKASYIKKKIIVSRDVTEKKYLCFKCMNF